MQFLEVLLSATGIILLMEIGDKTMFTTMCLSAQYRRPWFVLTAAVSALAISSLIAVLLGSLLSTALPIQLMRYVSAFLFLILGFYSILKWNDHEEPSCENPGTMLNMFTLILFSELGDKSQVAILGIAVQLGFPLMVFFGSLLAFVIVNAVGIFVGEKLSAKIPMKAIRIGSGIIFLTFGALILLGIL